MSKLFLTSYLAGTKNLVKEFLKDVPEKEITFVPTASNPEDYKRYVDEAKQAFLKLGFSIIRFFRIRWRLLGFLRFCSSWSDSLMVSNFSQNLGFSNCSVMR